MEKNLLDYLKCSCKPIVLYGMGNGADKIIDLLYENGIKVSGVFATDSFVRNKIFRGFPLTTYSALKDKFSNMIILMSFGSNRREVFENIEYLSKEQELFVPEVPVYGKGLFTTEFAKENSDRLRKIYSMLYDQKSRQTFEDLINYKISGRPEYLFHCQVSCTEPYDTFLKLGTDEAFVDLGAYNGDTVSEFTGITNCKYNKIYAVEPDKKTFKKLIKNTSEYKNIQYFNACVTNISGSAMFNTKAGRGSSLGGEIETPALSVDDMLKGCKATYIKYDVEGEEINAIRGTENTILKYKPKMLISAYHRNDDILTVPEEVFKIRSDYKLYLRHFPYLPAWDTNYYFV